MKRNFIIFSAVLLLFTACSKTKSGPFRQLYNLASSTALHLTNPIVSIPSSVSKKKRGPETVVGDFVLALSTGECDEAIESTTGRATETVQSIIDSGCEKYETIILGVKCEENEEDKRKMKCSCEEDRTDLIFTYVYDLELIKRRWKIENFQKQIHTEDN